MAGDADMSRDEMVARIAVLEAMVLKLVEIQIRAHQARGNTASVDGLVYSLGEAVGHRRSEMPEHLSRLTSDHMDAMMRALAGLTFEDGQPKN